MRIRADLVQTMILVASPMEQYGESVIVFVVIFAFELRLDLKVVVGPIAISKKNDIPSVLFGLH
jgi:hypothetical protein